MEMTKLRGMITGDRVRAFAWPAAAAVLTLPAILSAPWTAGDYVVAAILLFVPLGLFELAVRRHCNAAYKAGTAVALLAAVLIMWASGAVGITDGSGEVLYYLALVIGLAGAFSVRFRPAGMARAMMATAISLAAAGTIALATGMVAPHNSPAMILAVTACFAVLFVASALCFQTSARGGKTRKSAILPGLNA